MLSRQVRTKSRLRIGTGEFLIMGPIFQGVMDAANGTQAQAALLLDIAHGTGGVLCIMFCYLINPGCSRILMGGLPATTTLI